MLFRSRTLARTTCVSLFGVLYTLNAHEHTHQTYSPLVITSTTQAYRSRSKLACTTLLWGGARRPTLQSPYNRACSYKPTQMYFHYFFRSSERVNKPQGRIRDYLKFYKFLQRDHRVKKYGRSAVFWRLGMIDHRTVLSSSRADFKWPPSTLKHWKIK